MMIYDSLCASADEDKATFDMQGYNHIKAVMDNPLPVKSFFETLLHIAIISVNSGYTTYP
jgi:hypothetical protein